MPVAKPSKFVSYFNAFHGTGYSFSPSQRTDGAYSRLPGAIVTIAAPAHAAQAIELPGAVGPAEPAKALKPGRGCCASLAAATTISSAHSASR